jgi:hypothetical protein
VVCGSWTDSRRAGAFLALLVLAGAAWGGQAGLIGHWPLDAVVDGAVRDASGGSHAGRIIGAALAPGRLGKALQFDGRDDHVLLGDLGHVRAVTIAFWCRAENAARDAWQGLVTSGAWEQGVFHIPLRQSAVDVYLHLGAARRGRLTSPPLKNKVWYHVALTADAPRGELRLYLNGTEVAADHVGRLAFPIKLDQMMIGREGAGRFFRGRIDDVRIYRSALSAKEIRALCPDASPVRGRDPRDITTGRPIPDENYCDQPYVVITKDERWLCTLTTGRGHEGQSGQHIVAAISGDAGRTWSDLIDIEPADGPEASWVVPIVVPSGRVYAFYTYNGDRITTLNGKRIRSDTFGWHCFKYSDDGGRTWSDRHRLPMRVTACDRGNNWNGKVQLFWGIDKPKATPDGAVVFAFTKLGRYMLEDGEGWLWRSDNLLTEPDVGKLHWTMLPEGDHGIRAPQFGSVQEEHNMVPLSDGSLYCVYRTTTGYPCHAYSRDGGRTWTQPVHMTYRPGGRRIKNPRACPKLWRTSDGKFLFWFHNHSGKSFRDRNPAWVAGGIETDGRIHWSQPEILLYHSNPKVRMSYPDLIEHDGQYWVTETNKSVARVHPIDPALFEGLWAQFTASEVTRRGLAFELDAPAADGPAKPPPKLDIAADGGLTVDAWLSLPALDAGQTLLDNRDDDGRGLALTTAEKGALRIELSDGQTTAAWTSDPGMLQAGNAHHVVAIADDGPKIILFLVDGVLCDGGEARQFGWGRYTGNLGDVSGTGELRLSPHVKSLRLYSRALRTSEAVSNYRAGL